MVDMQLPHASRIAHIFSFGFSPRKEGEGLTFFSCVLEQMEALPKASKDSKTYKKEIQETQQ